MIRCNQLDKILSDLLKALLCGNDAVIPFQLLFEPLLWSGEKVTHTPGFAGGGGAHRD